MEPTNRRLQFESTSSEPSSSPTPPRRRTLFEAVYCGFSVLDDHYSRPMLPWIVAETKESSLTGEKVILRIANGSLLAISQESQEALFEHGLCHVSRYCRCRPEPECFAYLLRPTDPDAPLTCHVFLAVGQTNVYELFAAIQAGTQAFLRDVQYGQTKDVFRRGASVSDMSSTASNRRLSGDLPERDGVENYEVLYIGRVELADRQTPNDFIDDAVNKFEKYRTNSLRRIRLSVGVGESSPYEDEAPCELIAANERRAALASADLETPTGPTDDCSLIDNVFSDAQSTVGSDADSGISSLGKKSSGFSRAMLLLVCVQDIRLISLWNKHTLLLRKLHDICRIVKGGSAGDHVGFICRAANFDQYVCYIVRCRSEEIAHMVMQSMKCVITATMEEGKRVDSTINSSAHHCCPLCPMEQFAALCCDLEGLTPLATHELILSRIGQLDMRDQERVIADYKRMANVKNAGKLANIPEETMGATDAPVANQTAGSSFHRQNVILMSLLRKLCELRQKEHEMCPQNAKRSINLSEGRRRSLSGGDGLSKLFELGDRAKRSFSISLDTLGRKFGKGEELAGHIMDQFTRQQSIISNDSAMTKSSSGTGWSSPDTPRSERLPKYHFDTPDQWNSPAPRQRSRTVGEDYLSGQEAQPAAMKSGGGGGERRAPKMHVLSKLAASGMNTPVNFRQSLDSQSAPGAGGPLRQRCATGGTPMSAGRRPSWRQAIFQRVVISPNTRNTDSPRNSISSIASMGMPAYTAEDERRMSLVSTESDRSSLALAKSRSNSITDPLGAVDRARVYRSRWRRAIMQQILENRLTKHRQMREVERNLVSRMKLEYEEISMSDAEDAQAREQWNRMLKYEKRAETRFDRVQVEDAVKAGVPRDLRADVWRFLMEQHVLDRNKRKQMNAVPPYDYADLLKDLTPHQHAILIDLGRTFPSNEYFARQLGPGQLSLFNILKAYSLYDPEVGYCQGLSFIAGALLLHMEEEEAFDALVDLMYRMGLRKQYRPDMLALQIQMYQLSRLLHDRHRDLHMHLEDHEIPMLYAAPWFLTLFASTFPLGFVSRVIDFIFLSGSLDVVFKIALVLLGEHKELIMHCDSFEAINDFLKSTLPGMGIIQMERVFNAVFELDLSRDLLAYEVEYHMLHEELCGPPSYTGGAPSSIEAAPDTPITPQSTRRNSDKLEETNLNLKRQNTQLMEQLQSANQRIVALERTKVEHSSAGKETEKIISGHLRRIADLEKRVKNLEMERQGLIGELTKLTTPMRNGAHSLPDSVVFATPASLPKSK
uniref:Rab-GAP TBC domain-containing protein n=1 Tax=Plectus sambesii TaxID=2011161 RepID=A0A914ULT1_9BILA